MLLPLMIHRNQAVCSQSTCTFILLLKTLNTCKLSLKKKYNTRAHVLYTTSYNYKTFWVNTNTGPK